MKKPVFDPAWPPEVQEIYRNDLREMWDPSLEPQTYCLYQNQLRVCLDLVERYGPRTILDVGCAQATLALLLAEAGKRVTAVDIRAPFLEYARSRHQTGEVEFRVANIVDRPALGVFDLVFSNQTIEHVVYPVEFLRCLAGYLDRAGVLVLTTPNQQYLRCGLPSYRELGDPGRYEDRQFSAGGGDHFFAYTEDELRSFVAAAGLDVLSTSFFETPWISGHMKVRYLQQALPTQVLRALDQATLMLAGRRLGHHLCLVARRSAADSTGVAAPSRAP